VGLLDFVGVTGSGFVNTWYDQSGGGYNFLQNTTTTQPRVISSGSIYRSSNKPAIYFNDIRNDNMLISGSLPTITQAGHYTKFEPLADNRYTIFSNKSNRNLSNEWNSFGIMYAEFFSTTRYSFSGMPNANPQLYSMYHSGSTVSLYINGLLKGSTSANFTSGDIYGVGPIGLNASALNFEGFLQEHILYPSSNTSNRTILESNIQNQYTASFDSDYQAFITATGITQPTQSAALETLVSDLKSYGLWSKMKAIYPMVTDRNNRFAQSEDFSSTWNKDFATVTTNSIAAPDGTTTADLILDKTPVPVNFTVINNGFNYEFADIVGTFPTLSLEEGKTYTFDVQGVSSDHPFALRLSDGNTTAVPGTINNDPVIGRYGGDGNINPIT
jgi:hypothetical protein